MPINLKKPKSNKFPLDAEATLPDGEEAAMVASAPDAQNAFISGGTGVVQLAALTKQSPFMSVADLSQIMGISTKTALRWIEAGKLQAFKPGRHWKIPREAIIELLKK